VLQDGRFSRIGDEEERRLEARVICTSNRRMEEAVESGAFRQDLYYRINVFRINLPRLSERREDIPQIASYLFVKLKHRYEREAPGLSPWILQMLQSRTWKGNVRELENSIASYVLLGLEETLEEDAFRWQHSTTSFKVRPDGTVPLKRIAETACRELNREVILKALQANRWNRRRAAEELKISYRALLYKIRDAGLGEKSNHATVDSPFREGR